MPTIEVPKEILDDTDAKRVFLWFWRFYPELQAEQQKDALLVPANLVMPDCPQHSYASAVSALTGAMFPEGWELKQPESHMPEPYLLLFTFSPVQEFIKASRKFLDFWAGSYLLHYLSTELCWFVADRYGADAVITPSLWGQEIIDALILKKHPGWDKYFAEFQDKNPIQRFNNRTSTSLSTAGFPNTLTVLAPSRAEALALGQDLANALKKEWKNISDRVREDIKARVIALLNKSKKLEEIVKDLTPEFNPADIELCRRELEQYRQGGCWEWNSLWDAQIDYTWERYLSRCYLAAR